MASLLLYVGGDNSGYRDGEIMRAHTRMDALAARAECIVRGRGIVKDPADVRALRTIWERYTPGPVRRPSEAGLRTWWDAALSTVALFKGLRVAQFERYPFTHTEGKTYLAVHLDREITVTELSKWPGKQGADVNWRALVANGKVRAGDEIADEASVLDRRVFCFVPNPLPANIVLED